MPWLILFKPAFTNAFHSKVGMGKSYEEKEHKAPINSLWNSLDVDNRKVFIMILKQEMKELCSGYLLIFSFFHPSTNIY